jgi:hypothetical protein
MLITTYYNNAQWNQNIITLGTVHYLYPRGGGQNAGGHVKFIFSYGGTCFFGVLRGGGCRKKTENIIAPVYI